MFELTKSMINSIERNIDKLNETLQLTDDLEAAAKSINNPIIGILVANVRKNILEVQCDILD